jgi:hypothetical protein
VPHERRVLVRAHGERRGRRGDAHADQELRGSGSAAGLCGDCQQLPGVLPFSRLILLPRNEGAADARLECCSGAEGHSDGLPAGDELHGLLPHMHRICLRTLWPHLHIHYDIGNKHVQCAHYGAKPDADGQPDGGEPNGEPDGGEPDGEFDGGEPDGEADDGEPNGGEPDGGEPDGEPDGQPDGQCNGGQPNGEPTPDGDSFG